MNIQLVYINGIRNLSNAHNPCYSSIMNTTSHTSEISNMTTYCAIHDIDYIIQAIVWVVVPAMLFRMHDLSNTDHSHEMGNVHNIDSSSNSCILRQL